MFPVFLDYQVYFQLYGMLMFSKGNYCMDFIFHIFFKYPGTVFLVHLEVKTTAVVTYCHILLQRKLRVVTLSC